VQVPDGHGIVIGTKTVVMAKMPQLELFDEEIDVEVIVLFWEDTVEEIVIDFEEEVKDDEGRIEDDEVLDEEGT